MELALVALITLLSYMLGSIPSAYIVGRLVKDIDIRTVGSRNVGALNTFHQVGPGAAIAVLVADTLKGVLAILLSVWIGESPWAILYGAIGVVAGHNWPVFLRFRGGKGAATVLGVSLVVQPWLTLIAVAATVLTALPTRNVVLGAAVGFVLLNVLTVVSGQGWLQVIICLLLTFVVTATYLGRSWQQTVTALRQRRLQDLFLFE